MTAEKLTGKFKAFKLLLSRGAQGITSAEIAALYDGRTITARINELIDEGKATSNTVVLSGVKRAWYRIQDGSTPPLKDGKPQPMRPVRYELYTTETGEEKYRPVNA